MTCKKEPTCPILKGEAPLVATSLRPPILNDLILFFIVPAAHTPKNIYTFPSLSKNQSAHKKTHEYRGRLSCIAKRMNLVGYVGECFKVYKSVRMVYLENTLK
ncbi:hypothetical protein LguiA_033375 [Lonicera macranthoides]